MSRPRPYRTTQTDWSSIFDGYLIIPMNQRQYSWKEDQLEPFLQDLIDMFEEDKYAEKMGSIILYTGNKNKQEIYDGQQRTITTLLLLLVLSKKSIAIKTDAYNKLCVNTLMDTLTSQQEQYRIEYGDDTRFLKFQCVNPFDSRALIGILNGIHQSIYEYVNIDEDGNYICTKCNTKVTRKNDFKRHLIKVCEITTFSKKNDQTLIYDAFDYIYSKIATWNANETTIRRFYTFIMKDVDLQKYESDNAEYVSKIFNWENNRGTPVNGFDIVKNLILSHIPDDKKVECFDKWCKLKSIEHPIYTQFGERLFNIAIQLYNRKIEIRKDSVNDFSTIIEKGKDVYKELHIFFKIVEKCIQLMTQISEHRIGRLLLTNKRFHIAFEFYKYLLLPISYITNRLSIECIEIVLKLFIRSRSVTEVNQFSFGKWSFIGGIPSICNALFENGSLDYLTEIKSIFKEKVGLNVIQSKNYIEKTLKHTFKSYDALYVLYFLETCITSDNHTVSLSNTLEHIIPQSKEDELQTPHRIHSLGNLTLLEGTNSKNGHKGNSSIKDKIYADKRKSYQTSCVQITKQIAEKYENFTEQTILDREKELIQLIEKYTRL